MPRSGKMIRGLTGVTSSYPYYLSRVTLLQPMVMVTEEPQPWLDVPVSDLTRVLTRTLPVPHKLVSLIIST